MIVFFFYDFLYSLLLLNWLCVDKGRYIVKGGRMI